MESERRWKCGCQALPGMGAITRSCKVHKGWWNEVQKTCFEAAAADEGTYIDFMRRTLERLSKQELGIPENRSLGN